MGRLSRVNLIHGDFRGTGTSVRPPWAIAERAFVECCTRCDACIQACPERIIARGHAGFPVVDFNRGECTFCAECVAACAPRALLAPHSDAAPDTAWRIKAHIQPGCLALDGVECRVCGEHCEARAIHFQLAAGAVATPEVDHGICNGCGACVSVCPVQAVVMHSRDDDAAPEAALA